MFMMTMPPTTKAVAAIAIMAMKKVWVRLAQRERKFSLVSMAKLSEAPGASDLMTMPPTTKAVAAIAIMAMKKVWVRLAQRERKFSLVSMAKLSEAPGA